MKEFSRRKTLLTSLAFTAPSFTARGQNTFRVKKARVIVALADNKYQGIVPISESLGNGQSARTNLYWGALYGVKTYFSRHKNWTKTPSSNPKNFPHILDHAKFLRASEPNSAEIILTAEAWDGAYISQALSRFYSLLSNPSDENDLVIFVGHNTLMDKSVPTPIATAKLKEQNSRRKRQAIILACGSSAYFDSTVRDIGVSPLVTTKGLMAPEAYTLEAALTAWAKGTSKNEIRLAAAKNYSKYQKIPEKNARWLFNAKN